MTIFDIARYTVPRRNFLPSLAIFGLMIGLAGCSMEPAVEQVGSVLLTLNNGNFTSAQTLQITYNAVASESPESILYTSTTDGTEPADPSLPASNPTSYTLGTNISILQAAESQYRIRVIARNGSKTSAEVSGRYTRGDTDGDGVFDSMDTDDDNDGVLDSMDIDDDNDGLIEITGSTMAAQLTMLHNMRFNLAGTSYDSTDDGTTAMTGEGKAMEANPGSTAGAPTSATANCSTGTDVDGDTNTALTFLCGYELVGPLSFDKGSDGTWTNTGTADAPAYSLDSADTVSPYFVTADGGWIPIGTVDTDGNRFTAVFEGNGHSITGLAVQRDLTNVGMFGVMGAGAEIRNLGLIQGLADYSGSDGGVIYVGGLVGYQNGGQVTASYSTGSADGGVGGSDRVGGLIGYQGGGSVTASYSSGSADGGAGATDYVGGLIGWQQAGQVTASYSSASADGGAGSTDFVGGLVGVQTGGQVTASYSSGNANGGADGNDLVGSFIGWQQNGLTTPVTASYGFGTATGEQMSGTVGLGTAGIAGTAITNTTWTALIARIPSALTLAIANDPDGTGMGSNYNKWNNADENTLNAWNFDMKATANGGGPALNYADYDGDGDVYYCTGETKPTTGTPIEIPNCGTLIPGQVTN